MTDDEWIKTAEAAAILGTQREATMVLLNKHVARRGEATPGYQWRRADVEALAATMERKTPVRIGAHRHDWPKTPQTRMRPCLCCGVQFESQNFGVRLCDPCRASEPEPIYSLVGVRKPG